MQCNTKSKYISKQDYHTCVPGGKTYFQLGWWDGSRRTTSSSPMELTMSADSSGIFRLVGIAASGGCMRQPSMRQQPVCPTGGGHGPRRLFLRCSRPRGAINIVPDCSSSPPAPLHRRMMWARQHRRRFVAPSPWPYRRRRMRLALASSLHKLRMGSKSAAPRDRGIACKGNRLICSRAVAVSGDRSSPTD